MTSFDRVDSQPAGAGGEGAARSLIGTEFAETLKLAIPLALTQLAQIVMMTTDLALIGRLGTVAVAAAALGQTVAFMSFVIGMGLVSAVAPLTAQAFGARDPRRLRRALRVGLWTSVLVGVPITVFQLFGKQVLLALGQSPALAELAEHYLEGMAWGAVPGLLAIAIRGFMGSVKRPEPGLWIMLAAIPLNGLMAYALIYGAFGLPQLGLFGAGLGTSLVNYVMCIASMVAVDKMRPFKKFRVFGHVFRPDWVLMRELIVVGAPISIAFALEYGLFGSAALLMGLISPVAVTAHQIALNVAAVLFMVPFGISMAATVRVGHAVGRGEPEAVRRAGLTAIALGVVFVAVMTAIVLVMRDEVAVLFLGVGADREAYHLTAALLIVGTTFFIGDGIQTVAAGSLRGMSDTRVPMLMSAVSYWLVGFVASCLLGFTFGLGAPGVWIGLSIATAVHSTMLVTRFVVLTRRFAVA